MFIKTNAGEIFNVLLSGGSGSWIISYDTPSAPIYVSKEEVDSYERIEPPTEYVEYKSKPLSDAAKERLDLIKPLLGDERCIADGTFRSELLKTVSSVSGSSVGRLRKLYFTYLATGMLTKSKHRESKRNPVFDAAIREYYFSAKRNSLKTSYELMILESFTDNDGNIIQGAPSLTCFSHYFYRNYKDDPQRSISRDGLTNYLRNERMLYGSAMAYRDRIGSYQIDETTGDIYLVSSYDRSKVIGRPNIYMAVDTVTGMITGVHVSFDAGETAMMRCIANASSNKIKYCIEYGIAITEDEWPCTGLPSEIICDRGQEFIGKRAEELCNRYGIIINGAPPFRAELKPLIERAMGLIQDSYRSVLQGKGIINADSAERWAVDYRKQAVLTLEEYTRIVIAAVITLNKSRVLENLGHLPSEAPNTPLALWNWFRSQGKDNLLRVDEEELYARSLPRTTGTVTRMGITFNNLRYIPAVGESLTIGTKVTFAYDDQRVKSIYVLDNGKFIRCHLAESSHRYSDYSGADVALMKKAEREDIKLAKDSELKYKVKMRKQILEVIESAGREVR